MYRDLDLTGRRAFVTGGDAGIGHAVVRRLTGAGARVAIGALTGANEAARLVGNGAAGIDGDLGTPEAVVEIVDKVTTELGGCDILVLNAGVQIRKRWEEISSPDIDRQVAVNLTASLHLIQAFAPQMAARGWGRIVVVGSVQATRPHPEMLIYAGLKAALENVVRNLARQLAPAGVTCNVVAPGVIETDRTRAVLADPAQRARTLDTIPAGRVGRPEDCAAIIHLLASDAGGYITGATMTVDGGMSA